MLDKDSGIKPDDIRLTDVFLAPSYGRRNGQRLAVDCQMRRAFFGSGLYCQNDGWSVSFCPATEDLWECVFWQIVGQSVLFGNGDGLLV